MIQPPPPAPDALLGALQQLLQPLARLALGGGLTHATLDEALKLALVAAADQQLQDLPEHRRVSRIATSTGIHRREAGRLVALLREGQAAAVPAQRSLASELFTHWRSDRVYRDREGAPAELPRQGPAPSFESLAQTITRDVHPRSLMEELVRLGLAAHDEQRDTVRLLREAFVPQGDQARMLGTLGRNVGSHLDAAVDNLLQGDRRHFEQALFADGLSEASLNELRGLVQRQWQGLLDALVPTLEAMVARDSAAAIAAQLQRAGDTPPPASHRVRLGLYSHFQADPTAHPAADPAAHPTDSPTDSPEPASASRRRRRP